MFYSNSQLREISLYFYLFYVRFNACQVLCYLHLDRFQVFWDVMLCHWASGYQMFQRIIVPYSWTVKQSYCSTVVLVGTTHSTMKHPHSRRPETLVTTLLWEPHILHHSYLLWLRLKATILIILQNPMNRLLLVDSKAVGFLLCLLTIKC